MKRKCLSLLVVVLFAATGCAYGESDGEEDEGQTASRQAATTNSESTYDFENPDMAIELDADLEEISGLTLLGDGRLGAVQDEDGVIFVLDSGSGAVVARRSFGEGGDYEGIERVDDDVFVLRSDGTLIELTGWSDDAVEARVIETDLKRRNDTEGLAYDAAQHRLLIVCKERPGAGLEDRYKAVYAYDLTERTLVDDPVYTIDTDEIQRSSGDDGTFKPSALAIHPATGAVYVLSSTTKMIAVLDAEGGLQQTVQLPGSLFAQPEGLVFLSDGTLYIASEGDGGSGMLYAFSAETGEG